MSRLAIGICIVAILGVVLVCRVVWGPHPASAEPQTPPEAPRDAFAQDREPETIPRFAFDGRRAMSYLEEVCRLGPRISGSEGMRKQQELLKKHFESLGLRVELQRFTGSQPSRRVPVPMANLIASWQPDRPRRVILCCHYDTRPLADQEEDPRKWQLPFVGANDGGSGVAFLMELANHLKDFNTQVGIDLVCFDAEEYIYNPDTDRYFLGSEHFAQAYRQAKPKPTYLAALLFDMIAGRDARFPMELNSVMLAGALVRQIWQIAAEQRCAVFVNGFSRVPVQDDHLALNRVGIPAIDIIDFDYPHWHRLSDVPANCSPEPMEQVARVVIVWLHRMR